MTGSDITVGVAPLTELSALEARWRSLERRADPSFFQTWSWIGSWLELARFETPPRVIEARRYGDCVGLAIIASRGSRRGAIAAGNGLYLNETGDPDYDLIAIEHNGFLADRNHAADVGAACIRWLVAHDPSWTTLRLGGVPVDYATYAEPLGVKVSIQTIDPCPIVELVGLHSVDHLLARLRASTRRQYLQSLSFYQARGEIRLDAATDVAQAHEHFTELKRLHVQRWQSLNRPHAFRAPFFEKFHRALIARGLPEGQVEFLRLTVGGRAVAYLYNFQFDGRVYNYQCGFEYESASRARPGLVSQILAIDRAIGRGAREYDLLAGATRFKSSIASKSVKIAWLTLQRENVLLRAETFARTLKRWFNVRRN
ncbi:MAG TPA: GNAT family N-acetyltransferase [Alphaproteobacteria bacterium]|nr:GNAT family N-acetyltransferase [Alphaproteobacteria bacterium]